MVLFACVVLSAQEGEGRVLFDASKLSDATFSSDDIQTDNSADRWFADFGNQGIGKTAFTYTLIKGTGERGVGIKVEIPNDSWNDKYVSVVLRPNIIAALTENESGNGKLVNVGDVKSVTIKGTSLGYDFSVRPIMVKSNNTKVGMSHQKVEVLPGENFEVKWDNPSYITDVNKRDIKVRPIYPNTSSDLLLEGIEVRGKVTDGFLIVYLNTVTVVADKAYEERGNFDEDWGLEGSRVNKDKLRQEKILREREKMRQQTEALMVKADEEN